MKLLPNLLVLLLLCSACATSQRTSGPGRSAAPSPYAFIVLDAAEDTSYGYSEDNPIKVGGARNQEGPLNERRFLEALAGPNGELISYHRLGSCCHFETNNGIGGFGLLDRYAVSWKGLKEPLILYINMYDFEELKIPVGFTARK